MATAPATLDHRQDVHRLQALADDILREATRQGASTASAAIGTNTGLSVTVRLGEVETIEHHRNKGLTVTVYFGHKRGWATTSDFSAEAISSSVHAACEIARYTSEDPCAGLADADCMAREIPELDLYHPWPLSAEQASEIALETETAARDFDDRISNSEGAEVSHFEVSHVYANTHGFNGGCPSSRHSIRCAVIAKGERGMQRDDWFSLSRDAARLEAPKTIGVKAAQRAVRRLDARPLTTRSVPVVFSADVAPSLFRHMVRAISGGSLYRKSSFLLDHLGKQIFPPHIHINEEPHIKGGLGSAPFDGEGVATRQRTLIGDGILQGYILSSYSARKLGMKTTGNAGGAHNLIVKAGDKDLDGLLGAMDTGLLVSELMGMGVNTVTGDYSRGASGYWVEGGQIQHPVEEITIAGNLRDMFMNIREIGTDTETRGSILTGSVLIEQMTVAGG